MTPDDYGLTFRRCKNYGFPDVGGPKVKKFTAEHHLWSVYWNGVFICYLGMLQTYHDYTKYYPRVWNDNDSYSFDSFEPFVAENSREAALTAGLQYIKEQVQALKGENDSY